MVQMYWSCMKPGRRNQSGTSAKFIWSKWVEMHCFERNNNAKDSRNGNPSFGSIWFPMKTYELLYTNIDINTRLICKIILKIKVFNFKNMNQTTINNGYVYTNICMNVC